MWLKFMDDVPWDPFLFTEKTLGIPSVWSNLLWVLIGGGLLSYAVACYATGQVVPLFSKKRLKRYELPTLALIVGVTLLLWCGKTDLLTQILAQFNIKFQ